MRAKLAVSVSSCTYKSGIFQGFSRLQQSDEFVDMTLAAEGHLVKVHQTLVALASPYLKSMLLSIPCRHPVIFLSGISHEVLGFILEYIYTGEVEIPAEKVKMFLRAAQVLHISGLKNAAANDENTDEANHLFEELHEDNLQPHPFVKPVTTQNSSGSQQEHVTNLLNIESETQNKTGSLLPFNIDTPSNLVCQNPELSHPVAKPFVTIQNCRVLLPNVESETENMTASKLPPSMDIAEDALHQSQLPHPVAKPFVTIQNCRVLLPNVESETENMTASKLPPSMDIAEDALHQSQQSGPPVEPIGTIKNENYLNLPFQESVIDQTGSPLSFSFDIPTTLEGNNEYEPIRNMHTCGKNINMSYDVNNDNDNTRQKPVAKINIISDVIVQQRLPELNETNDRIPLNLDVPALLAENKLLNIFNNTGTPGKSINISYNNNMHLDENSQKPVANIEIVSNTFASEDTNYNNDQQLPELYADAIASMKTIIGNNISMEGTVSKSKQNISNELDAQQSNPVSEPTGSDNIHIEGQENDSMLYTVSSRGALQLILNKYMYYCHYQRDNGRKRRWRCIDYREFHCPAAVDTVGEQIVDKKFKHSHPTHDNKIRKKIVEKEAKFFPTIKMAEDTLKKIKKSTTTGTSESSHLQIN